MATKLKPVGETVENVIDGMDAKRAANLRIWDALSRTDPKHTKGFKRGGGFSGTAIKPIWITQRLTELFGSCGKGWGVERPDFQVVNAGDDILVYCTVTAWYLDEASQHFIYGVGGDVVRGKNKYGPYTDDEAFKKAFTDALGNAFKFVGVGADVHMGLFEDSKYLAEVSAEFHPPVEKPDPKLPEDLGRGEGEMSSSALRGSLRLLVHHINGCASVDDLDQVLDTEDAKEVIDNCKRRFPAWWETGENMPAEFVPLKKLIEQTRKGLSELETAE